MDNSIGSIITVGVAVDELGNEGDEGDGCDDGGDDENQTLELRNRSRLRQWMDRYSVVVVVGTVWKKANVDRNRWFPTTPTFPTRNPFDLLLLLLLLLLSQEEEPTCEAIHGTNPPLKPSVRTVHER